MKHNSAHKLTGIASQ